MASCCSSMRASCSSPCCHRSQGGVGLPTRDVHGTPGAKRCIQLRRAAPSHQPGLCMCDGHRARGELAGPMQLRQQRRAGQRQGAGTRKQRHCSVGWLAAGGRRTRSGGITRHRLLCAGEWRATKPACGAASEEAQHFPPRAAHHAPQSEVNHAHQGAVAEHLLQSQVACSGCGCVPTGSVECRYAGMPRHRCGPASPRSPPCWPLPAAAHLHPSLPAGPAPAPLAPSRPARPARPPAP